MSTLPRNLYTAAQVRELDRRTIEDRGVPGYELMTRAGAFAAQAIARRWPGRPLLVVCGAGNNAGDGYVVAARCLVAGGRAEVVALVDPTKLKGDAATAWQDYLAAGGVVTPWSGELRPEPGAVIVDALLGTGLDRPVEGRYRAAIEALNRHPAPLLAVDVPSGLHADTGAILGVAAQAACTLTFIGRKRGLYTGAGGQYAGSVEFADLAVPPDIYATQRAAVELVARPPLEQLLAPRRRDAHKGDFGHLLVVGGNAGMCGAARLAAEAAARCGGGLVSVDEIHDYRMRIGGKVKAEQIRATGADIVIAPCANCKKQLKELVDYYELPCRVVGLHDLVLRAIDIPGGRSARERRRVQLPKQRRRGAVRRGLSPRRVGRAQQRTAHAV